MTSSVGKESHPLRALTSLNYEQRGAWIDSLWLLPGIQSQLDDVWLRRLTQLPGCSCYLLVIIRLQGVSERLAPHIARIRAGQLGEIIDLSLISVKAERQAALTLVKPQAEHVSSVAARLSRLEAANDTMLVITAGDLEHVPNELAYYLKAASDEKVAVDEELERAVDFALVHDVALGLIARNNQHSRGLVLLGSDEVLSSGAIALGTQLVAEQPVGWRVSRLDT